MKYLKQCIEQLNFCQTMKGSFLTMVKSGEVQYGSNLDIKNGFLHGVSDRPRNIMVPSDNLCGLLTVFQSYFW